MRASEYLRELEAWEKSRPKQPKLLISEEFDGDGSFVTTAEIGRSGGLNICNWSGNRMEIQHGTDNTLGMDRREGISLTSAEALDLARWIIDQFRSNADIPF